MLTSIPSPSPHTSPWLSGSSPLPPPGRHRTRRHRPGVLPGRSPQGWRVGAEALKRRACPDRKRGGQPCNSNAFRHGLYSSHTLRPHAALFRSSSNSQGSSVLLPAVKRDWIAALNRIVVENRLKLLEVTAITSCRLPFTEMCSWLRAATSIVGTHLKVVKALHELGGRQEHLRSLVRELPALLHWEFGRRGIPARPAFVPQELNNFHANLVWESRRLTASQWLLLQEIFSSLHIELDSVRQYRRRKPLPADRILLEGILWKLTGGLRWQDLPDNYPARLCQDLYSALCRTGHMQAIYKQLHWHLNVYGEATLAGLVERGCFEISGNHVLLSPSEELTWEKYTALLLLQQACHARRAIQREADLECRRRGAFYRLPAIRLPNSHPQPARPPSPPSSLTPTIRMLDILQASSGLGVRDLQGTPVLVSMQSPHPGFPVSTQQRPPVYYPSALVLLQGGDLPPTSSRRISGKQHPPRRHRPGVLPGRSPQGGKGSPP